MEESRYRLLALAGVALGGTAVALGALGAHALADTLGDAGLPAFQTAIRYQALHAIALIVVGLAAPRNGAAFAAGVLFVLGSLLFSGSLYVLVLTGIRWVGPITPLGGVALIAGWIFLGVSIARQDRPAD